jgi:hypothetical protein
MGDEILHLPAVMQYLLRQAERAPGGRPGRIMAADQFSGPDYFNEAVANAGSVTRRAA